MKKFVSQLLQQHCKKSDIFVKLFTRCQLVRNNLNTTWNKQHQQNLATACLQTCYYLFVCTSVGSQPITFITFIETQPFQKLNATCNKSADKLSTSFVSTADSRLSKSCLQLITSFVKTSDLLQCCLTNSDNALLQQGCQTNTSCHNIVTSQLFQSF